MPVPKVFDLHVKTNPSALTAELRLTDAAGNQLAWREVRLKEHATSWEALFDLRRYVQLYAEYVHDQGEAGFLHDLGVFLGREVLGAGDPNLGCNLFSQLVREMPQRTLRVRLPASEQQTDDLTAAFARVPWEIARAASGEPTLAEKNVSVRAVTGEKEPVPEPLALEPGEPLRVLLVFAEAPGSPPLAAQRERRQLLALFHGRIYPQRRVEVDVLSHGVTRERLKEQIQGRGGYHVLHWSGHGNKNLLELYAEDEEERRISGQELVRLFEEVGGYPPRLVFLGACYSGDVLRVRDWQAFEAVLGGHMPGDSQAVAETSAPALPKQVMERPGYTGTAHALLEAGIPSVVAMRYEVGDDYARDLATEFYERLLADKAPKSAEAALNQARRALLEAERRGEAHGYAACDHATPVFYGAPDPKVQPPQGSWQPTEVHPRLRIAELRPHPDFVGRSQELTWLGAHWLGAEGARPVAVLRGLGGLGKTALAAEAIGLWHEPFRWVFAFQAKPAALPLDDFLRNLHATWMEQQGEYAARVAQYPAEAIWRPASEEFTGARRQEALRENLVAALRAEPVLLVLDNFETCLVPQPAEGGAGHASQDPSWDALLAALTVGLIGSNSRVLITSRWQPAALGGGAAVEDLLLGPLPPGEAALYVRSHPVLRKLVFEGGDAGRALVLHLVHVSRGHPLLLDRLARLAERDTAALDAALQSLEEKGLAHLPDVFTANAQDPSERRYLEDALTSSIDLVLDRVGADARRALWVLALADEPMTVELWQAVWTGPDFEEEQIEQLKELLARLPPTERAKLPPLPDDVKAKLAALEARGDEARENTDFVTLRRSLVQSGLVTEERDGAPHESPDCTCHESVRERVLDWMDRYPAETGGRSREQIWAAYGDRLVSSYQGLVRRNQLGRALQAGARALRYVVRAGALEKLGQFASQLVTSTGDPRALRILLPELECAAAAAPPGKARWRTLAYVADALRRGGQPEASIPQYAAAAAEAKAAEAWSDLAGITGNWANALLQCAPLEAAQEKQRESARWAKRAGRPAVDAIGRELEALRIDVRFGRAAEALPEIGARLSRLRAWWEASQRGEDVPEAPDHERLGRALIGALDIDSQAHLALERWQPVLDSIAEKTAIKRARGSSDYEIAIDRLNRYGPLLRLGRLAEAQQELEHCLAVFERAGDETCRAMVLSALADLSNEKDDQQHAVALERRALALRNTLADPVDRAISHNNLGGYLERAGELTEAAAHELAALLYLMVTGHGQYLQAWTRNRAIGLREARQSGHADTPLRVADLLASPGFGPLRDWLTAGKVDVDQLEQAVDAIVAHCREAADVS